MLNLSKNKKVILIFGGRDPGKGFGGCAGLEFMALGAYKHSDEKHKGVN